MRDYLNWQRHLDEVFVKIKKKHCLWRAVDHEGAALEL